jgi:exopolysaccharide biosynthesis polyprenyl glycosylphosphotransferase
MYFGKKQRFDWTSIVIVVDLLLFILSLCVSPALADLAYAGRFGFRSAHPLNAAQAVFYMGICFYFLRSFRYYRWKAFMSRNFAYVWLALALAAGTACFAFLREVVFQLHGHGIRHWLAVEVGTAFAILFLGRIVTRLLLADVFRLIPMERVAIVGWSSRIDRVLGGLQTRMGKFYEFAGFFSVGDDSAHRPPAERGMPCRGGLADIRTLADEKRITLLLVDEATVSVAQLERISDICSRSFVNLRIVAPGFEVMTSKLRVQMLAGVPVMGLQDLHHERMHNRIAKRLLDLAGGTVGLLLSAPVILVCGILIYLESPGPVFYTQKRMTRGRKIFDIYKLRSMRLDAEKSGAGWTVPGDPRRLRIGAFLRKYNLDELPQFWNVVKGDMSLVGPRPERPEFLEKFNQDLPHYNLRHTCKAGLTGWAAVNGLRGDTSLEERLEYDLYYIENWNFWLDLKTLFLTVFPSEHAY